MTDSGWKATVRLPSSRQCQQATETTYHSFVDQLLLSAYDREKKARDSLLTVVARMNRARFLSATLIFSSSNGYKSWQSMRTSVNSNLSSLETALLFAPVG